MNLQDMHEAYEDNDTDERHPLDPDNILVDRCGRLVWRGEFGDYVVLGGGGITLGECDGWQVAGGAAEHVAHLRFATFDEAFSVVEGLPCIDGHHTIRRA